MRKACTDVEWFEDYQVGDEFLGEPVEFTEQEIVEFARRYDPQLIHIDREAAKASQFGGFIASGTHLFPAVWGGMMRAGFLNGRTMGAPGVTLRFLKPVRPGDTLSVLGRVREKRASGSRPDRGYVEFEFEATNQKGEVVVTFSCQQILPTRPK
jgi:acyl dehydratase